MVIGDIWPARNNQMTLQQAQRWFVWDPVCEHTLDRAMPPHASYRTEGDQKPHCCRCVVAVGQGIGPILRQPQRLLLWSCAGKRFLSFCTTWLINGAELKDLQCKKAGEFMTVNSPVGCCRVWATAAAQHLLRSCWWGVLCFLWAASETASWGARLCTC